MAEPDQRLTEAHENYELSQGLITDAEFKEDPEERSLRYLQAISHSMVALYLQNQVLIGLLQERSGAEPL
jgi:hypothetical protein